FAIPIDQVVDIVTDMIEQHNDSRITTGLRTDGGPREGDGITIVNVSASSPAERDGLKPGDRVVRVGSQPVDNRLDFALALLNTYPGEDLDLGIDRAGKQLDVAMRTESRSTNSMGVSDLAWDVIGVQARPVVDATMRRLNNRMRTKYRGGLYVTNVRPGSPADQQGILSGDVILGIHGWQTASLKDLAGILEHPDIQRGPRAKFYLVRREQTLFGHMELAAQPTTGRR
ncbi:MAG: PDZ domain-containing protein, partial [Rubripirellula sp.]